MRIVGGTLVQFFIVPAQISYTNTRKVNTQWATVNFVFFIRSFVLGSITALGSGGRQLPYAIALVSGDGLRCSNTRRLKEMFESVGK